MKSLITFLFIIVASTTYRCGKEEETIDCVSAAAEMIGNWDGLILYSNPLEINYVFHNVPAASGNSHPFTLQVTSSSDCIFTGNITYGEISNNTIYEVNGTIDKYGWVKIIEVKFVNDGKLYTDCEVPFGSPLNCNNWPTGRWQLGGEFYDGRFDTEDYEWEGKFILPSSNYWYNSWDPGTNNSEWRPAGEIAGNYRLTKR